MTTIAESIMSEAEFWVLTPMHLQTSFDKSRKGDVLVYAVGDLRHEREKVGAQYTPAEQTGRLAYALYSEGLADLTQKRLAPNKFEYRIQKT